MLPALKAQLALASASFTNGATATGLNIDCLGADFAKIDVFATTADVASNSPSVLKLQESNTTDSTNFADISGFVGGTDFTVATAYTAATSGTNVWSFNVDTRARKRYLRVVASPRTTMTLLATAQLGRMGETPTNAAQSGALNLVQG